MNLEFMGYRTNLFSISKCSNGLLFQSTFLKRWASGISILHAVHKIMRNFSDNKKYDDRMMAVPRQEFHRTAILLCKKSAALTDSCTQFDSFHPNSIILIYNWFSFYEEGSCWGRRRCGNRQDRDRHIWPKDYRLDRILQIQYACCSSISKNNSWERTFRY